jgi:hypothetical protein
VAFFVAGQAGVVAQDGGLSGLEGVPEIQVTLTDEGVQGVPAETPAGWTLVTFTNNVTPTGDPFADAWSLEFIQLADGMVAADVDAIFASGEGGPPASPAAGGEDPFAFLYETYMAGGPGALVGETGQGLVNLLPGRYAVTVGGVGAGAELTVTGEAVADAPAVTADVVVTESGTSGSFAFSTEVGDFAGGLAVIEIVNDSDQPHFIFGLHSPEAITPEQVMAILMSEGGTPPADGPDPNTILPAFITGSQTTGTTQYVTADLEPGHYVLLCFVGDPAMGGVPHSIAGMIEVVPVGV